MSPVLDTAIERSIGAIVSRERMRTTGIALIMALLVSAAPVHADTGRVAIELSRIDYWTDMQTFHLADLTGDGREEIIRVFSDRRTFQANAISRTHLICPALYQGNSVHRIESITPVDIDTLPGYELAIVKKDADGDSLWVEVICGHDKELLLCKTQAVIGKNTSDRGNLASTGWDGAAYSCHAVDLDDDGVKELIVPIVVGFDLYPRGVYVYSYPSGELRWRFMLAGNPDQPTFADANNDGFKEVYVKTWAVSNGAVVDERDDNTSYLFCLDHLGHPIWRQTLGDRFDMSTGNVHICDCDADGVTELYYIDLARQEEYDRQVRILEKHRAIDNAFLAQRSFDADQIFDQISTTDLNDDSLKEIIVDGFVGVMDAADLSILSTGNFDGMGIWVIEDIDDDDSLEIVLARKDSLYILDRHLNVLGAAQAGEGYEYLMIRHFRNPSGQNYLAALMSTLAPDVPNVVNIYEVKSVSAGVAEDVKPGDISWTVALGMLAVGLIIGTAFGMAVRRRRKRRIRGLKTAQYENLLTALASFDHGRMAGKNLNRLQFLFSNLPESTEKLEQIRPNIKAAIQAYHAHTAPQLNNVAQYGMKLASIRTSASRLIKHRDDLSDLIPDDSVVDLDIPAASGRKADVSSIIEQIQSTIRDVKKTVQSYFSADLLQVVPTVLIAIVSELRQNKIGFRTIETRGGPLRLVFFDEVELAAIFEELLSNACDAMAESKRKELTMLIDFGVDEVIIRLSDTGCGLAGADPERLFSRDFSTKRERGGYGLYHARQQVERFGGRISIYENEDGVGATVELILKTVHHE